MFRAVSVEARGVNVEGSMLAHAFASNPDEFPCRALAAPMPTAPDILAFRNRIRTSLPVRTPARASTDSEDTAAAGSVLSAEENP
jgi:hypothetical protein